MITTEYDASTDFATLIAAELDRLNVSSDNDPCSGLMIEMDKDSEAIASVFTDHARGEYYADQLLSRLAACDFATLDPDSPENIWDVIRDAEVR